MTTDRNFKSPRAEASAAVSPQFSAAAMRAGHVIREVWRGEGGVLYRCRLECTCAWVSEEVTDPALLRVPRALHLDGPWGEIEDWSSEPDTLPDAIPLVRDTAPYLVIALSEAD